MKSQAAGIGAVFPKAHFLGLYRKVWILLKRNCLEFNISPGKLAFKSNQDGVITEKQLRELGVLSFFNPLLHPSVTEGIAEGLTKDGFECLNQDKPDQLTIVHLLASENRNHFTVALCLD